jgi:hypothetical protein
MPVNQTDPRLDDGEDSPSTNPTETDVDEAAEQSESDDPA